MEKIIENFRPEDLEEEIIGRSVTDRLEANWFDDFNILKKIINLTGEKTDSIGISNKAKDSVNDESILEHTPSIYEYVENFF